ncbi:MAG: hypothetical protein GX754_01530, partial [Clostridiaceae bacterium]|nr:hypothetical protein [Clostridiaceae bacterium]
PYTMSKSINDELTATVIALEYENLQALLISATVCLINTFLADKIREMISKETAVPVSNIIISATHTHSGPNTGGAFGWGDIDEKYCSNIFIPQIINAAKEAILNLKPAKLGIGTIESYVGINRRQLKKDNKIYLGQNPYGCFDKIMTVLSFKGLDDSPIVNIIHYGAHCTAAGCNTEITRDWAGVMIDRLEKESEAVTAFFNGAEGDVGPRLPNGLTTGDISYAMELGAIAGYDAVCVYKSIKEYQYIDLKVVTDEIKIPYRPRLSLDDAERALDELEGEITVNLTGQKYKFLNDVISAYKLNLPEKKYLVLKQTIVRIGPVVFIPFAYEVFSEISLRLREYSAFPYTLCLSNTNGNFGYLPSQDQICRGGYEIEMFLSGDVQSLVDDADNYFISENLRLMEKIK